MCIAVDMNGNIAIKISDIPKTLVCSNIIIYGKTLKKKPQLNNNFQYNQQRFDVQYNI